MEVIYRFSPSLESFTGQLLVTKPKNSKQKGYINMLMSYVIDYNCTLLTVNLWIYTYAVVEHSVW